jgi:type IV pilus assembly protein PilW
LDAANSLLQRTDNTGLTDGLPPVPIIVTNEPVASGIVDMQAQYGIAADGASNVTTWVDATAASGWNNPTPKAGATGLATAGRLQDIKAVRISLLARSSQYEKPSTGAGGTCDATAGSPGNPGATGSWSTWATFNTSVYPADWKCYRYRAFEIVLPLRNVIWANL